MIIQVHYCTSVYIRIRVLRTSYKIGSYSGVPRRGSFARADNIFYRLCCCSCVPLFVQQHDINIDDHPSDSNRGLLDQSEQS